MAETPLGAVQKTVVPVAGYVREQVERLKIACLSTGVRISREALDSLGGGGALTVHEYPTTGGVTFVTHGVYVNAPFDEPFCERASVELVHTGEHFLLLHDGNQLPVDRILPLPGYLGQTMANGRLAADLVMSHADRARLSPLRGCAYDCGFCNLPELAYQRRSVDELSEALDIAAADAALPVRHVLISGGTPGPAHADWFSQTCADVVKRTQLPVDVMFSPQAGSVDMIDRLFEAGVEGFSINLEIYDNAAAQRHMHRKAQLATPYFEATIRRAINHLGTTGRVRSLIIPGLEPESRTIAGIEYLASLGVDPVISPFRPSRDIALVDHPPASEDSLRRILDAARAIAGRYGVALGPACVPCQHNTLTFPWDVSRDSDAPA
ncbi:MAG: radical SAM protein [Actinomycetota bacterium]